MHHHQQPEKIELTSHVKRYLTLFQYRFNHRFHLQQMMVDAIGLVIKTKPGRLIKCELLVSVRRFLYTLTGRTPYI